MEKNLQDFPSIVSLEKTKKIIEQMENCICKIYNKEGIEGTGYFCYIFDPNNKNKKIPVLMTNHHIIREDYFNENQTIKLNINNGKSSRDIKIDSKRKKYTNKKYDLTIIEIIKEKDGINSFLEIDDRIFQKDSYKIFNKSSVYVIQYPTYNEASVSYGVIRGICIDNEQSKIFHYCDTNEGSSGSPILEIGNNKVIGIHFGSLRDKNFNLGIFLKNPINEFFSNINNEKNINIINNNKEDIILSNNNSVYIDKSYEDFQSKNEVSLTLNIEKKEINKIIYFLDNTNEYIEKNKNPHCNLLELNKENTELFIDNIKYQYQKFFVPPKEGIYKIKLKFKNFMKDCSYMFYLCKNIIDIDFSFFKTKEVTNMSNMFCYCTNITELDLSSFNTENVKDMSKMFSFCGNLRTIDLTSFNIKNVLDMNNMFTLCNKLDKIDISSFITPFKINTTLMFDRCWNVNKVKINKKSLTTFKNALKNIDYNILEFCD